MPGPTMPEQPEVPSLSNPAQFRAAIGPYLQWPLALADAIEGLEASDWFSVQSTPSDATAGLVMLNGAHGLGVTTQLTVPGGDIDAITLPTGSYRVVGSVDQGVFPPPGTFYGVLDVKRYGVTDLVQVLHRVTGGQEAYERTYTSGAWSTWKQVITTDSSGNVGIGTATPTELLDVNGDAIRIRSSQTPASASATGTTGTICWDANYIYTCVATNTWTRAALATW